MSTPARALPVQQKFTLRWSLPLIVLAAFVLRLIVVCFTYRDLPDADKFYEQFGWEMGWVARSLASGHGFSSPYWPWSGPTAMQPPLYPSLLALVFRLFGIYSLTSGFVILSLNSLMSSLTCIPVYFSGNYSLGRRAGVVAASIWAFYPFAIYFSAGRVWEYSLTTLLFTTCFCIAQRLHLTEKRLAWAGWGLLFGLTALSNPAVLATLPFLFLVALWRLRRSGRRWMLNAVVTPLAVLAILAPWTVRNYRVLGILCPVRDNFWLEFYSGNYGDPALNPVSPHPASNPIEMQKFLSMGEKSFLQEKHTLGLACIRQHPQFIVQKTVRRFFYYWSGFWSISMDELRREPYEPGNIFYCSAITFLMLCGIRRLWQQNREAVWPYLVLIGIFPLTYYLTYPLMDYRQPIEPAIVVLAAAGILSWRKRRGDHDSMESRRIDEERVLQFQ